MYTVPSILNYKIKITIVCVQEVETYFTESPVLQNIVLIYVIL